MADESNPWAWNAWAQTQDPGLYGWKNMGLDQGMLQQLKPALQSAGLWKPEYDTAGQWREATDSSDGGWANNVDLSGLSGYGMGNARSSMGQTLETLLGPDGKPLTNPDGSMLWSGSTGAHGSLTGSDYATLASVPFAGLAAPLAGYFGGGMTGAAASGATLGAASGAMRGQGTDGNMLGGALKGGLLGGIGGAAGNYFSGGELQSGMDMAADTPIDWSKINPGIDMTGFDNSPISLDTSALDQAVNRQPLPLDGNTGELPPIQDLQGNDVAQFTTTGQRPPVDLGISPREGMANLTGINSTNPVGDGPMMNVGPVQPPRSDPSSPYDPETSKNLQGINSTNATDALAEAAGGGSILDAIKAATGASGMDLLKGGALLAGAVAGSQGTPAATTTQQSKTDPRFDPYLYGSGGVLQAAQDTYNANKTPNADMTAGWNTQRGLLTDPAIQQQLQQFRTQGQGLLGGSIAANPFTTGKAKLLGG